jgi:heme exporter protein D
MPDLGKYAEAVLGSYAVSIVLIALLVGVTMWRGNRVRSALREVEARQGRDT